MKVAYISFTGFSDCDLPLVRELIRQGLDITYYLIISDRTKKGAIIDMNEVKDVCGVFPASDYPALHILSQYINLSKVRVANMTVAHNYAPSTFLLAYKLRTELQEQDFDLIHLTWPVDYPFYQLYTLQKPYVLTVHDPIPHSNDETLRERFKRYAAFKRANKFILLNTVQRQDFENRYHIRHSDVELSRLGIYTHLSNTPITPSMINGDYILFTGSILPYKGVRYIVQAMERINKQHPEVKLVIAGRGKLDFDIQPYINGGNVVLINRFITNEELSSLIFHSKFVCCPYTDATQSGVVMSAFALDKPVLATEVGALHEMIDDGRHGMLVPPCDSTALADAADTMLTGNTLTLMSENIRQDYSRGDRSWNSIARGVKGIYESAVKCGKKTEK